MGAKRVLLVSTANINCGGVKSFLFNWVKHASKDNYKFVWFILGKVEDPTLVAEFEQLGVEIVVGNLPPDCNKFGVGVVCAKEISRLIKEYGFDMIHVNSVSMYRSLIILFLAKILGVKRRIVHSHGSPPEGNRLKRMIKSILRELICSSATDFVACSRTAAQHLFGDRHLNDAIIINNCIDTKKFAFLQDVRAQYRDSLGLANNFVLGHVGAFCSAKNHDFLIDVFKLISARDADARLLLMGAGELEKPIKKKVLDQGLEDKVIFTGVTDQVPKYLCAMDLFLLPSLHEGLPIVGIEAQTSGLFCVFSDAVTTEVQITENCRFISLEAPLEKWADAILELKAVCTDRENVWKEIYNSGYDVSHISQMVDELYSG